MDLASMPVEIICDILRFVGPDELRTIASSCVRLWSVVRTPAFAARALRQHYPNALHFTCGGCDSPPTLRTLLALEKRVRALVDAGELEHSPFNDAFCDADACWIDASARAARAVAHDASQCGSHYIATELLRFATKAFALRAFENLLAHHADVNGRWAGAHDALEYGVALFGAAFCPTTSLQSTFARLDTLAAEIVPSDDPLRLVRHALDVMASHGIRAASQQRYYELCNSVVQLVVADGGRGIPISLSVVLRALLARRGLVVNLLNVQWHFVMSFAARGETYIVDAFNSTIQSVGEFRAQFEQAAVWSDALLEPVGSFLPIWLRWLHNICGVAQRNGNGDTLVTAVQFRLLLHVHERAEQSASLHLALIKMCVERQQKAELLWAVQRECPPLLPRIGRDLAMSIVAGWIDCVRPVRPSDMHPQLRLGCFVIGSAVHFDARGVVVGWRNSADRAHRALVLFEGDSGDPQWCDERTLAYLVDAQVEPLGNVFVGRYFVRFTNGRYVPNRWLRESYPDDA